MGERPGAKGFEGLAQRVTERCDRVFHADRGRRQDGPSDKAVAFQPFQGVGKRLVRDAVQPSLDRVEPRRLRAQDGQDEDRPLVRNPIQNGLIVLKKAGLQSS